MSRLLLPLLLAAGLLSCGKDSKSECRKDTDCKGDRICEKGRCIAPTVRPAPDMTDPDPDPDPDPGTVSPSPSPMPVIPGLPSLPKLNLPNLSLGQGGLNLNFKLQVGADEHTIEMDPTGNPAVKWCVNKKCDVMDLTKPADVERMLERLANTAGNADPQLKTTLQMLRDLSSMMNQGGGLPVGVPGTFTNQPSGPKNLTTYRSAAEIVAGGEKAEGAEGLLSDLSPTIVSSDQVTFRTSDGITVDLVAPAAVQSRLPGLARATGPQTVRFRILRVTAKYIKGEILEIPNR
jgi:hypothetical protein